VQVFAVTIVAVSIANFALFALDGSVVSQARGYTMLDLGLALVANVKKLLFFFPFFVLESFFNRRWPLFFIMSSTSGLANHRPFCLSTGCSCRAQWRSRFVCFRPSMFAVFFLIFYVQIRTQVLIVGGEPMPTESVLNCTLLGLYALVFALENIPKPSSGYEEIDGVKVRASFCLSLQRGN